MSAWVAIVGVGWLFFLAYEIEKGFQTTLNLLADHKDTTEPHE